MANKILIKRGTREQIQLAAVPGNSLTLGEMYLITDENRLAVGTGSNTFQDFAKVGEGGNVNAGSLDVSISGTAATSGTAISWGTATGFNANSASNFTYDLRIGPALTDLVGTMAGAGTGFLKKDGADNFILDTSTYLTAEADTLGTVTARGATTSTATTFSGGLTVNATSGTNGITFVGQTSGSTKVEASAVAGTTTITLPGTTGTVALRGDTTHIGTTSIALNRASANLALTGISSIALPGSTSGSVTITPTAVAGTSTITLPAATGTVALTNNALSTFAAAAADISIGGFKITNLAAPSAATDAANKAYVDGAVQGIDTKASVRVATAATLGTVAYNNGSAGVGATLTNTGTLAALVVDTVAVAVNDRILVKNQPTAAQNGIYTVTNIGSGSVAWILTRATDNDTWDEIPQAYVFVEQGTQENNGYLFTADQGGTMGSTAITITQFSGAGQITDGAGLQKTGNTLDVRVTSNRTVINGNDEVDISPNYAGQTSIITLGEITSGTWSATAIAATRGGTGLTTYATGDILYASAANTLTKLTKPATLDSFLQMTAAGVPSWESTIDGGTF